MSKHAPYTVYATDCPFEKDGFPVVGTRGQTFRAVVVIERATFLRLIDEHPTLADAEFTVATLEDGAAPQQEQPAE